MEWEEGDKSRIFSVFRSLIWIAALSSPSTFPIKNLQQREKGFASSGSSERTRKSIMVSVRQKSWRRTMKQRS